MVEYLPSKQVVAGSSPVFRSIKTITPNGVIVFMGVYAETRTTRWNLVWFERERAKAAGLFFGNGKAVEKKIRNAV